MVEALTVYRRLAGARIRSDLQYRGSFALFVIGQFLVTFLDFLTIAVIFSRTPLIAGWPLSEVAFLYGLSGVGFGLADLFVSPVGDVAIRIKDGTFDRVLIRPAGSLLQVVADDFRLRRAGKILQAALVLAIAATRVPVSWTVAKVAMVGLTIVSGAVVFGSIWVLGAAICFWAIDSHEVSNSFTYGGNFATQYPLGVYSGWLRRILVFGVGLASVAYLPATWILGRHDTLGLPAFLRFASPAVALVMALAASAVWRVAVRHYRSTGS